MQSAKPFAMKAGAALGGAALGKWTGGPSNPQQTAMQGQQRAAQQVGGMAGPMMQTGLNTVRQGTGYMQQAGSYYGNILSNRRAASESLAPEMKTMMDQYGGAARKAQRTMRGWARDSAVAELDRERVGNAAMMLPMARAQAAQGMGQLANTGIYGGQGMTGQGINAASNAGQLYGNMFRDATTVRGQEKEAGKEWGDMLYDVANTPWGGGKKPITNKAPAPTSNPGMIRPPAYPGGQRVGTPNTFANPPLASRQPTGALGAYIPPRGPTLQPQVIPNRY